MKTGAVSVFTAKNQLTIKAERLNSALTLAETMRGRKAVPSSLLMVRGLEITIFFLPLNEEDGQRRAFKSAKDCQRKNALTSCSHFLKVRTLPFVRSTYGLRLTMT